MKKLLLLLCFIGFVSQAQIVTIPDANFKSALINDNVDTNNDGEIQESEAQAITTLDVSNRSIFDLTGISSFINLNFLFCDNNELSTLDLTGLTDLVVLDCQYNQLTTLTLTGLTNLQQIDAQHNNLDAIDVSTLDNLRSLVINHNQLLSLDLSGLLLFENLRANNNQISNINLSDCPNIISIRVYNNNLTSIDFSDVEVSGELYYFLHNNALTDIIFPSGFEVFILELHSNQFVDLDLSNINNTIGYITMYDNPIQTLNLKNGNADLPSFGTSDWVETLEFVCVDDFELNDVADLLDQILVDADVSSYCTFEPGGEHNRIAGTISFDEDSNGCTMSDTLISDLILEIDDGTNQSYVSTNAIGDYNAFVNSGTYNVIPSLENTSWFTVTPMSSEVTFTDFNNVSIQDFCIASNGVHEDIEIVIIPVVDAQPGFDAVYDIVYKNKGNLKVSGDIEFNYEASVLDFVSTSESPILQNPGELQWSYTDLIPFESRSVTVTLNVNAPTETPAVNIDDELPFTATITPTLSDENPSDNVFQFKQVVVGSFDPNDITCLEGQIADPTLIGDYLHYNIRFENTGTAAATFVVVTNDIDETQYDLSSFQVLNASHPMTTRLVGNKLEFIFDAINLVPLEQGNVLYKIKTRASLNIGDSVSQQANIFFDYNFPIETNLATTTFETLSVAEFDIDNTIQMFPNPANHLITIKGKTSIETIEIYDIHGRTAVLETINDLEHTVDISSLSNGIYFVKLTTKNGTAIEKLIKN